jgi:hypothetical protein
MQRFGQDGFCLIRGVLNARECARVRAAIVPFDGAGRRGLLQNPDLRRIAELPVLVDLIRGLLAGEPFPVRAIYFRKSADSNWFIGWHQDLTIAVNEKCDEPEFGPWSVKEGLVHVQPPVAVLEQMLTVRLHLDDADEWNGALRVIPGSHRLGRLSCEQVQSIREKRTEVVCTAREGDALLMRPLLLHASGRSKSDRCRRVLHIEYAAAELPHGLKWRSYDKEGTGDEATPASHA